MGVLPSQLPLRKPPPLPSPGVPGEGRTKLLLLQRRQPLADGVLGQLGHAVEVELFHDLAAVGFDGLDAHVQARRDLLGRLAFGHELQHLALAGGQGVEARRGPAPRRAGAAAAVAGQAADVVVHHDVRRRAGSGTPCRRRPSRIALTSSSNAPSFSRYAARPGLEHLGDERAVRVHRQGDDLRVAAWSCMIRRVASMPLSCGIADVHDDDVGLMLARHLHAPCRPSSASPIHLHVRLGLRAGFGALPERCGGRRPAVLSWQVTPL